MPVQTAEIGFIQYWDIVFTTSHSLTARTLRLAILRIGLVSLCAGAISYFINKTTIEDSVREQLLLSTGQTLQRESLPFEEIRTLQKNFLAEFAAIDRESGNKPRLVRDFDQIFYRHADGSYTQRPGLFEGRALADGRRFGEMSATYAPAIPPNADIKARFALAYLLSHKYGSSAKGRVFNFYGVVPEKGFPIYQSADIANAFTYSGPDALKLETFEFYYRGFGSPGNATIFTRMYWDASNAAWMTTVATPDRAGASGKHRILACVDVLLAEFMQRTAKPVIQGARSAILLTDRDGTLIYHPDFTDAIKLTEGRASISTLGIADDYPFWANIRSLTPGQVALAETERDLIAYGIIPQTPWVLAVHYPKALMQPAIFQNLAIVIILGILTLLVEIFIIRSILQNQVALPLSRLIRATHLLGKPEQHLSNDDLPTHSRDEIGELARDFYRMAERVQTTQQQLELKVRERTTALKEANQKLLALSTTDDLTGIANRRRFDEVLAEEWRRARRTGNCLVLAMIDVDWFKRYNDHYGHQAGDACLRKIATILAAYIHRPGDLLARYGGEEFALIITMSDSAGALTFARTLCDAVAQAALPHEMSALGRISISIGVACAAPGQYETARALLKQADNALYQAKGLGRDQACMLGAPADNPPEHRNSIVNTAIM